MLQELRRRLGRLYSFFIKDDKGLQTSLQFALGMFLLEGLMTLYMFFLISSKVRFQGFVSWDNRWGVLIVAGFFLRVFLLHLLLGFLLRILEWVAALRSKKLYYFLVFTYAYLFLALKYPQNFDEFVWVSRGLAQARLFTMPWLQWIPAAAMAVLLISDFIRFQKKSFFHFSLMVLACGGLGGFFLRVQELTPSWQTPAESPPATAKAKPNIIFITLDSLRGDVPLEKTPGLNEAVENYLGTSLQFGRVVSPLAQTHAALTSLFTGHNPPATGIRTNLSDKGLQSDESLKASPLAQLKEAGYKIKFVQDAAEYAHFNAGNIIDTVQAPNYSVANVVISTFFKNRIVFGLFNNPVGYFFLPELRNNTSFFYAYDLPHFTTDVLKALDDVNEEKDPVMLFVHTCALHWPAVLPYPYYPQDSFPEHSNTPFSYTSKFRGLSKQKLSPAAWAVQSEFNKKIYAAGVQMTVNDFLNPVFAQIQRSGLDKNSIVVLLSDHGDDLWNSSSRYPVEKYVQHGSSLIFGASSELAYLRLRLPGQTEPQQISQTIGSIDILPTVMDYAAAAPLAKEVEGRSLRMEIEAGKVSEKPYYTETGLWPLSTFFGQFIATPASTLGPLFKVDPELHTVFVDPLFLPGIIQQKQRAIYSGKYRLTLYPTRYGFEEFLCDREKDFECTENLLHTRPEVTARLRVALYEQLQKDITGGLLKPGVCSPFAEDRTPKPLDQMGVYQWQYYFQALECLRLNHDYAYATRVFDELVLNPQTSPALKNSVKQELLSLCAKGRVYSKSHASEFVRRNLVSEVMDHPTPRFIAEAFSCLAVLGRGDEMETLRQKYPAVLKNLEYAELNGDPEEDSQDLQTNEGYRFLWHKYSKAQGSEKTELLAALQSHPMAGYYAEDLEVERLLHSHKDDPEAANEALEKYFAPELNYGLANILSKYYYLRVENLARKERKLAVEEILAQIVSVKTLPVEYFNYLLSVLDEAFTKNGARPGLAEIRFQHWNQAPHERSENIRSREVQAALEAAEGYYCGGTETDEASHRICTRVQKWLRSWR